MKKTIVGVFLFFFCMLLQPMVIQAASSIEIDTQEEWLTLADGTVYDTYILTADIQVDTTLTIPSDAHVKLDLNGYTVTGKDTVIVNNGYIQITDKSNEKKGQISAEINTSYKGSVIVNKNQFSLINTTISSAITNQNGTEMSLDIRVIDNVGSLYIRSGTLALVSTLASDKIIQELYGIYNYDQGSVRLEYGTVTVQIKTDSYSGESIIQNTVSAIYNEEFDGSTGGLDLHYSTVTCEYECNIISGKNELYGFAIAQTTEEDAYIYDSTINVNLLKGTEELSGTVAAIGNLSEAYVQVDETQIGVQSSCDSNDLLVVGIMNAAKGHVGVWNYSKIICSSNSYMDIGIVNADGGKINLQSGEVAGSIGVYSNAGNIVIAFRSPIMRPDIMKIQGTLLSLAGTADVNMRDGTLIGDWDEGINIQLEDGTFLLAEQTGENTKYYLTDDQTYIIALFVTRLYNVCLNREPDETGLVNWVTQLENGTNTGVGVATGFIFSNEFKNMNLCNEDYVKHLYRAFLGREADAAGLDNWVGLLKKGSTRESIINGFALSREFTELCAQYGIIRGDGIAEQGYGTIAKGACSVCGEKDGVSLFVERLYRICLNREADVAGLKNWTNQLWNRTNTGRGVAYGFIFSPEFIKKNHSNADYVEYLYEAFLGRSSDSAGKANWVGLLEQGASRESIFDGFVGSQEFTNICNEYGIIRG